jgi:hypothetical protein
LQLSCKICSKDFEKKSRYRCSFNKSTFTASIKNHFLQETITQNERPDLKSVEGGEDFDVFLSY